jgi:predicted glycogen debranching enzyme
MKFTRQRLLRKHEPASRSREAPLEWLVTNGLGGYAAGSVAGPPMRRFHGLLVAAHAAPVGRMLLLHLLEETVTLEDGSHTTLRPGHAGGPVATLESFFLSGGLPHWIFGVGETSRVEQTVFMPHDQNTVHVRYRLTGSGTLRLTIRPWIDFRPHEGVVHDVQTAAYALTSRGEGRFEVVREGLTPTLRMRVDTVALSFETAAADWNRVPYELELERGYDCVGSMHSPGAFQLELAPGRDVHFTASSESWDLIGQLSPDSAWDLELTRRERLLGAAHAALRRPLTSLLTLATDQFIVRPTSRTTADAPTRAAGAQPRTVIAGYPWFTDWGRDTMISLEGLTLVTGRHAEARDILHTFAHHVRQGLIPNLFPEGQREGLYHTADATLWFFNAIHRYEAITGDGTLIHELMPILEDIVRWHVRGTLFNIHVDTDGLLTQGAPGVQLTWMDAKVGDWVVTPRRGKAVEINALWYNALRLLERWLQREERIIPEVDVTAQAVRCRDAFNRRFWNPARRQLFDVVDGDHGNDDACRPNQILAIAVAHSPLEKPYWEPVFDAVTKQLLTPVGLRSLSPNHPDYKPRYFGSLYDRDAAYHQGTVWPWLIGPYIDAWLALRPDGAARARKQLRPLLHHLLSEGCVGSISEIFDAAQPFTPRGCCAQAWSVAELARVLVMLSGKNTVTESVT